VTVKWPETIPHLDRAYMTNKKPDANETKKTDSKPVVIKHHQAKGEIGGPAGLEPTRYGDWERKGIVSDF
jgi:hypothetical protein